MPGSTRKTAYLPVGTQSQASPMIKRFIATLCALALFVAQAAAGTFLINPYKVAALVPSITFVGCETGQTANATSYTFTNAQMGAADPTRKNIVAVGVTDTGTTLGITSMTVGGNSATEVVDEDGTLALDTAMYIIDNPTGTTATVVVTPTEQVESAIICTWALYNVSSSTAFASVADDDTSAGALILNHNTSAAGVSAGFCLTKDSAATTTWTGLTENTPEASHAEASASPATLTTVSASTPLSVTCDWSGTNDTSGVAAHFQ